MFAILVNNQLLNFWSNQPGDIFIDNTIKGLKLKVDQVKLFYYADLDKPEYCSFDPDGTLYVQEKIITANPDTQEETVSYNTIKTIPGEVYFDCGLMVKTC
jgi:hypothetical protein